MIEQFKTPKFRPASLKLIEQANEIITQYEADGIQLTLRQLYYQFVSRNWLANNDRNYKNLGHILSEARLAGLVDWEAIDDLGRVPSIPSPDRDLKSFLEQMKEYAGAYTLDHWEGQANYVELHVEKQALSSVLGPIAEKWGIGFSMNRGYSSQTAFYDASKRFIEADGDGKNAVCLYVGDHDPSGRDMVRDFGARMRTFGADVEIVPVALSMAQIRQYRCPPNPAKTTDARSAAYIQEFGNESWEVDALDPKVLRKIVEKAITALLDQNIMKAVLEREQVERERIAEALEAIDVEAA